MRTTYPIRDLHKADSILLSFLAEGCDCPEEAKASKTTMVLYLNKTTDMTMYDILTSLDYLKAAKLITIIKSKKGFETVCLTQNGFYNALIRRD